MFGRDLITPVAKLLEPKPRYYGEKGSALKMDTLRRLYTIVVDNIHKVREKKPKKVEAKLHSFKINNMVLVKDPDEKGNKSVRRSSYVKYVEPSEKVVQQLPSKELLQNYGRSSKMLIAAKDIPNLQFNLGKTEGTSESHEDSENSLEGAGDVVEVMECEALSPNSIEDAKNSSQDKEVHEHSINSLNSAASVMFQQLNNKKSLNSAAGVAFQQIKNVRTVEIATDMGPHEKTSECNNDLRKSREL